MTALEIPDELMQRFRDSIGQHWTAADLQRIGRALPDPIAGIRYGQPWQVVAKHPYRMP